MREEWTDMLRDKLSGYEESVPAELWDDIASTLSRRGTTVNDARKKRHTVIMRTLYTIAAAAAILIVCYVAVTVPDDGRHAATASVRTAHPSSTNDGPHSTDMCIPDVAERAAGTSAYVARNVSEPVAIQAMGTAGEDAGEAETANGENPDTVSQNRDTHPHAPSAAGGIPSVRHGAGSTAAHAVTPRRRKVSSGSVSLGLYAQNTTISSASAPSQNVYGPYSTPVTGDAGGSTPGYFYSGINLMQMSSITDICRIKHDFPVRAGLSVRYSLGSRVSLESGITYTYLSSHITSGNENVRSETAQKLHYVGIPLGISFRVWSGSRWEAYVAGGGEVQKCVSGSAATDTRAGGTVVSAARGSLKDDRLQWSANASAGIQFNVSPLVGIYAEPGISWHPDNGSKVETIYKDKPLNFNIKAGVRLTVK